MFIIKLIPQSIHVRNNNITSIVVELFQSILRFFVLPFVTLYRKYSNTRFMFLPCFFYNSWNVIPQHMKIECLIISRISLCQKQLLTTLIELYQLFFELYYSYGVGNQIRLVFHNYNFQKSFNVAPQI